MKLGITKAVLFAAVFAASVAMFAPFALAHTTPTSCDGYCWDQHMLCYHPNMRCCCKVAGVWECQCKLATDCNTGNDCQDGGST